MPSFDEIQHHEYWQPLTSWHEGSLHGTVVYDTAPSPSGNSVYVATDDGVDYITIYGGGYITGWVEIDQGVTKAGSTQEYLYMLAPASGVISIHHDAMSAHINDYFPPPSGGESGDALETLPNSNESLRHVYPMIDYNDFADGDISANTVFNVQGSGSGASLGTYLTLSASGTASSFSYFRIDRDLKLPCRIKCRYRITDADNSEAGRPYIFSPMHVYNSTTYDGAQDSHRCSIRVFKYLTSDIRQQFSYTDDTDTYYWEDRDIFQGGDWETYSGTPSHALALNTWYIAEMLINPNGLVQFWLKDGTGTILEKAQADDVINDWQHLWVYTGKLSGEARVTAEIDYFELDHFFVGDISSYSDLHILESGTDTYMTIGVRTQRTVYEEPTESGGVWTYTNDTTVSGGTVVIKNEYLGWEEMSGWAVSPIDNFGTTEHAALAFKDLYWVQRNSSNVDTLLCHFDIDTVSSGYILSDRRYVGDTNSNIPLPSVVNDMVVYSGTTYNTVLLATNNDGTYIIDHNKSVDTLTTVGVYGHENVLFHDSFVDEAIGERPDCWDRTLNDSDNQSVKVVRNTEPKLIFCADEVFIKAYDSETLTAVRTYNDLWIYGDYYTQHMKVDDRYVWVPLRYVSGYSYLNYSKLGENHWGIGRGDKDSDHVDIFDFTQEFAETFGETANIDDVVRFHAPGPFDLDDKYIYIGVYMDEDWSRKDTDLGKVYSSTGNYYARLLRINRNDLTDYDFVTTTGIGWSRVKVAAGTYGYKHPDIINLCVDKEDDNYIWITVRGQIHGQGDGMGDCAVPDEEKCQSLHMLKLDKREWTNPSGLIVNSYYEVAEDIEQDWKNCEMWDHGGYLWFNAWYYSSFAVDDRKGYRFNKTTVSGEATSYGASGRILPQVKFDATYCYAMGRAYREMSTYYYVYKHDGDYSDPTSWSEMSFQLPGDDVLNWYRTPTGDARIGYIHFWQDERSLYLFRSFLIATCPQNKAPVQRRDKSDIFTKSYWYGYEGYDTYEDCAHPGDPVSRQYYSNIEGKAYSGDGTGHYWISEYGVLGGGKSMEVKDNSTSKTMSTSTPFLSEIDDNYAVKMRIRPYMTTDFRIKLENNETSIIELLLDSSSGTSSEGYDMKPIKKRLPGGSFGTFSPSFDYEYGRWYELKIEYYPSANNYTVSFDGTEIEASGTPYNSATDLDRIVFYSSTGTDIGTVLVDNVVVYNPDDVSEEYSVFIDYPVLHGLTNRCLSAYKTSNAETGQDEAIIYCADSVLGGSASQIDTEHKTLYAYYSPTAPFGPGTDLCRFVAPFNLSFEGNEDYAPADRFFAGTSDGAYLFTKWNEVYRTSMSVQRLSYDGSQHTCYLRTKGGLEVFETSYDGVDQLAYYYDKKFTHPTAVRGGVYLGTTCRGVYFFDKETLDNRETPYEIPSIQKVFGRGYDYDDHNDAGWREGLLSNRVNYVHTLLDNVSWIVSHERGVDYITSLTINDTPFYWQRHSYENISGSDVCFMTSTGTLYYNIRDAGLAVTYTAPSGGYVNVYPSFSISGTSTSGVILGHPNYVHSLYDEDRKSITGWPPESDCHGEYINQYITTVTGGYPIVRASFNVYRVGTPPPLVCTLWNDFESDHTGYNVDNFQRRKPWPPSMMVKEATISATDVPTGTYGWVNFDFFDKDEAVYDTDVQYISLSVQDYTTNTGHYYVVGGFFSNAAGFGGLNYRAFQMYACEHQGVFATLVPYWWQLDNLELPYWSFGADPLFRINCVLWSASGHTTSGIQPDYIYPIPATITDIYVLEGMSTDTLGNKIYLTTPSAVYEIDEVRGNEATSNIITYGDETGSGHTHNILKGTTDRSTSVYGMIPESAFYVSTADGEENGAFTAVTIENPEVWDYMTVESGGGLVQPGDLLASNEINDAEVTYFERWRSIGKYIF